MCYLKKNSVDVYNGVDMQQKIKTVGIVSPSIMLSERDLQVDKWLEYLQNCGLEVVVAPTVLRGGRHYIGDYQEKAQDIMQMYQNPQIDALICAHGGAGALNVLEYLDYEIIAANPKPIFGFSDNTSLQMAVYAKTGNHFVTGFSPEYDLRSGKISALVDEQLRQILLGCPMVYQSGEVVNSGTAEGVLLGECLSTISDLNGTPYYPDISGSILLLEDEDEKAYKLGLMLTQLRLNPNFKNVKGIIFGRFADCADTPTQGTVDEVLAEFCAHVNVPVIKNFNFGHFRERFVLKCGVRYRLNADECKLEEQK